MSLECLYCNHVVYFARVTSQYRRKWKNARSPHNLINSSLPQGKPLNKNSVNIHWLLFSSLVNRQINSPVELVSKINSQLYSLTLHYVVHIVSCYCFVLFNVKLVPYLLRALGPELVPVSRQFSPQVASHKPSGRLPLFSTRPKVSFPAKEHHHPWPVPNFTAWWQRHMCVNNLPGSLHEGWTHRIWTSDLPICTLYSLFNT